MPLALIILYILYNETRKVAARPEVEGPIKIIETVPNEYNAKTIELPETLSFAGEQVPLQVPDVRERLDRELHINTYWHNNTIFLIKRANRWLPAIEKILKENGIPEDFKYLSVIESNLVNDVSPKKAVGFWQLMAPTARELGLQVTKEVDERYDPLKSTLAATKYLKRAYKKFGNWTNVAGAYNRGQAGFQRALRNQKETNYYKLLLNEETSRYVFRILACKEILQYPEKYGFYINQQHLYEEIPVKKVTITKSIKDLVKFAKAQGIDYKTLKYHNPWLRSDKLTVRKGKKYEIDIPVE